MLERQRENVTAEKDAELHVWRREEDLPIRSFLTPGYNTANWKEQINDDGRMKRHTGRIGRPPGLHHRGEGRQIQKGISDACIGGLVL